MSRRHGGRVAPPDLPGSERRNPNLQWNDVLHQLGRQSHSDIGQLRRGPNPGPVDVPRYVLVKRLHPLPAADSGGCRPSAAPTAATSPSRGRLLLLREQSRRRSRAHLHIHPAQYRMPCGHQPVDGLFGPGFVPGSKQPHESGVLRGRTARRVVASPAPPRAADPSAAGRSVRRPDPPTVLPVQLHDGAVSTEAGPVGQWSRSLLRGRNGESRFRVSSVLPRHAEYM